MAHYRRVELGQDGLQYVQGELEQGGTLANAVSRRLPRDVVDVCTFLPPEVSDEAARDFHAGGKLAVRASDVEYRLAPEGTPLRFVPVPDTLDDLVPRLLAFLDGAERRAVIFEDSLSSPGDSGLQRLITRYWVYGSEVYHVAIKGDTAVQLEQTVRQARAWLTIGITTELPPHLGPARRRESVTLVEVEALAKNADTVIVGAYDGEGFVLCRLGVDGAVGKQA